MFVKPDNLHCIVFTSIKRSLGAAFPNGISRNKIERDERECLCQDCEKFNWCVNFYVISFFWQYEDL